MDLGLEFQKINLRIKISILKVQVWSLRKWGVKFCVLEFQKINLRIKISILKIQVWSLRKWGVKFCVCVCGGGGGGEGVGGRRGGGEGRGGEGGREGGKTSMVGVIFITTVSLFHFFRNSQHRQKWKVSFNYVFRKWESISSCCLSISSNLLNKSFCYHTSWIG